MGFVIWELDFIIGSKSSWKAQNNSLLQASWLTSFPASKLLDPLWGY
jgi:hypothetical protein